jgi:hypothetical protein
MAKAVPARGAGVVSICVAGFPGTNQALTALAHATHKIRHLTLADAKPNGPEARFIMEHLEEIRPKTVILGGWSTHYEPIVRHFRRRGPFWAVYWTSSAGQMEMAGEMEPYLRVLDDERIGAILYADAHLASSALAALKPSDVFPVCVMPMPKPLSAKMRRTRKRRSVLSLFCSAREAPRKNVLTTLLALADLEQDFVLHLNGLARQPPYERLLERLRIPHRDFGWMERDCYDRAVAQVDVGLQVSLSESHNQVVTDHALRGIPVIASEMVPALRRISPSLRERLVVHNPDDAHELREKIEYLLARPATRVRLGSALRSEIVTHNARNILTALDVLEHLA